MFLTSFCPDEPHTRHLDKWNVYHHNDNQQVKKHVWFDWLSPNLRLGLCWHLCRISSFLWTRTNKWKRLYRCQSNGNHLFKSKLQTWGIFLPVMALEYALLCIEKLEAGSLEQYLRRVRELPSWHWSLTMLLNITSVNVVLVKCKEKDLRRTDATNETTYKLRASSCDVIISIMSQQVKNLQKSLILCAAYCFFARFVSQTQRPVYCHEWTPCVWPSFFVQFGVKSLLCWES